MTIQLGGNFDMEKKKRNALFEDTMLDGVDCIMVDGNPQFVKLIDEKIEGRNKQ